MWRHPAAWVVNSEPGGEGGVERDGDGKVACESLLQVAAEEVILGDGERAEGVAGCGRRQSEWQRDARRACGRSRRCGRPAREGRVRIAVADVAVVLVWLTGLSVCARALICTCRFAAAGGRLLACGVTTPGMTTSECAWALGF